MSVEDIFSSKGRVKVLKTLAEKGEMNISEITRRAGLQPHHCRRRTCASSATLA